MRRMFFQAAILLKNSCLSEEDMAKGNGILKKKTSVSNLSWPRSPCSLTVLA